MEFEMADLVFLMVSLMCGVVGFGQKEKVSKRYVGPFEIRSRIRDVAYCLALPSKLADVHDFFHVSMLWKYFPDPTHTFSHELLLLHANACTMSS